MNKLLFITALLSFWGCIEKRLPKTVTNGDVTVNWYYYIYFRDRGPDMVEIKRGDERYDFFESRGYTITDVFLNDSDVVVKFYNHQYVDYETKKMESAFGYKILLDSTATEEDSRNKPKGKLIGLSF